MFTKCVIIALTVVTVAVARSAPTNSQNSIVDDEARSQDGTSYLGDLRYMYRVYQECAATDLASCLKLKLVAAMDRVARNYPKFTIFDGVSFIKQDGAVQQEASEKSEAEIEASLPRSLEEKDQALNSLIVNKIGSFFDTHTLQIKLPTASDLARSFNGEARKKDKKGSSGLMLIPLILGGTLIPLALGALALLAGKALIVAKLALVLAGIIGLKKLISGGGSHESGHEVVVASGGHGGSGWGRSLDREQAQNLAYSAYAPKSS